MLPGRLGLDGARIPQSERHGLLWLEHGQLSVEDGTLRFVTTGGGDLPPGDYAIPFQMVSVILLGPGSTVSHDALRLMARHGTGLIAVGTDGVRHYASMPFGPKDSTLARKQVRCWSKDSERIRIARRLYAWKLGEVMPEASLEVLRGIEGARAREMYRLLTDKYHIEWKGRRYDRGMPERTDDPNQAINHAAVAVRAAACIAVACAGAIPSLGFIHEESELAFALDIADMYRDQVTLPSAFEALRANQKTPFEPLERSVRVHVGRVIRSTKLVSSMIDRITELFDDNDGHRDQ